MAEHKPISDKNLSRGIDQRSAEASLEAGFVEDAINVDVIQDRLRKRTGYQAVGQLPVSIVELRTELPDLNSTNGYLTFVLPGSVDLTTTPSVSIIAAGIVESSTSLPNGDFSTTYNEQYYTGGEPVLTTTLVAGSNITTPVDARDVPYSMPFAVALTEKTTDGNDTFEIDSKVVVDAITGETSLVHTSDSAINSYIYYKDKSSAYTTTVTGNGTHTILATSHGLSSANIFYQVWKVSGGNYEQVFEHSMSVDFSGNVSITINEDSGYSYYIVLSEAEYSKVYDLALAEDTSIEVEISGASSPFMFASCFTEEVGGRVACVPNRIRYESTTNTHYLQFVNYNPDAYNIVICYEYGIISANKIKVKANSLVVSAHSYLVPQIAVYGFLNKNIYKEDGSGMSMHIDSYRSETTNLVVAGMGGNLFGEIATNYTSLFPSNDSRASAHTTVAPAFWGVGFTPTRTRGYVETSDTNGSNAIPCLSVTYVSTGVVSYLLSATAHNVVGTPIEPGDYFSAAQMEYSINEGSFKILGVSYPDADTILLTVSNPAIIIDDYNQTSPSGYGSVISDRIPVADASLFLPGDIIEGGNLTQYYTTVVNVISNNLVVYGISDQIQVPAATRLFGKRTSEVLFLKNALGIRTTNQYVAGDVIDDRYITYVNPRNDQSITIAGDIVTLPSGYGAYYSTGDKLVIGNSGVYTVAGVLPNNQLQLTTTPDKQGSAVLPGKHVILDYPIEISSSNSYSVNTRFYQLVRPTSTGSLINNSYQTYYPNTPLYDEIPIRSSMVANNLYLTNGIDSVMKFDGANHYEAGLFGFNPLLVARFVTDSQGNFGRPLELATTKGFIEDPSQGNRITVVAGVGGTYIKPTDVNMFKPGDYIKVTDGTVEKFVYVSKVETTTADYTTSGGRLSTPKPSGNHTVGYIYITDNITNFTNGTDLTISLAYVYKYYFRLNAVDANRNIVASNCAGIETSIVQSDKGYVYLKLIQPPVFGNYDYDSMELQIYRTLGNGNLYKLVATLKEITFDSSDNYIEIRDTYRDTDIQDAIDPTSVLINGEVGTTFAPPPKAAHITSVDNRLVLANIKSQPKMSLIWDSPSSSAPLSFNGINVTLTSDSTSYPFVFDKNYYPISGITHVAGTSFTIQTSGAHGLSAGDWVYLFQTSLTDDVRVRPFIGYWKILSVTTNSYTISCKFTASSMPTTFPSYTAVHGKIAVFIDSMDLSTQVSMYNSAYGNIRAAYRLSRAINSVMRAGNTNKPNWSAAVTTKPGELYLLGRDTFTITIDSVPDHTTFINDRKVSAGTYSSLSVHYPSRLVVSYQNYPELFDNIYVVDNSESDSVIDINPSDGQEITGIISFFGDTAFGAALRGAGIIVFKTNSVYIVDVNAKAEGKPAIQKLATHGIGCVSPRSIAVSKDAIFFLSHAGIYALKPSLRIEYAGRVIERLFESKVNQSQLLRCCGHHDPVGKMYKLSFPEDENTYNTSVLVYNHSQEIDSMPSSTELSYSNNMMSSGAWTRYTNFPATGWANLNTVEYFSSTKGWIYSVRPTGGSSAYADEGSAIAVEILLRAQDFGVSGIRKQVRHLIAHYRPITSLTSISLYTAIDLSTTFESMDTFEVDKGYNLTTTTQPGSKKLLTLGHSLQTERGNHFQVKLIENGFREAIDFVGIDYLVLPLSHHGITDASSTKK